MEFKETPIERRFAGTTEDIKLIVAGKDIAVQEIKKIAPISTACQVGNKTTIKYPNIAIKLKIAKAFL